MGTVTLKASSGILIQYTLSGDVLGVLAFEACSYPLWTDGGHALRRLEGTPVFPHAAAPCAPRA